ncbi:MAG: metallophosphoesterase [Bacteroidota bacterium]|nr:metallophosphoesterase [Bacteroidota bacterium]
MGYQIILSFLLIFFSPALQAQVEAPDHDIQIVFTSDAHFGITRKHFRGDTDVSAMVVNRALVQKINDLPQMIIPRDGGVDQGRPVKAIDYVIEGGDIANRMEIPIQSAAVSWSQFDSDYIKGLHVWNHQGKPATLLMIPGNHDISDAIGFYKPMRHRRDPTSMVQIYNRMLHPRVPLTNRTYDYSKDRINYSRNIGGVHFMFITLWPDSLERIWMQKDLKTVPATTPVIIFTHDEPVSEAKHFTNPNPGHTINDTARFENLLATVYEDGNRVIKGHSVTTDEQLGWEDFLKQHPNIKAYFHGNTNFNQFYEYHGPDGKVSLPTFRVDSPMKGRYSKKDETKLSFQLITLDPDTRKMTVRECLWNVNPSHPGKQIRWGSEKTVNLN